MKIEINSTITHVLCDAQTNQQDSSVLQCFLSPLLVYRRLWSSFHQAVCVEVD